MSARNRCICHSVMSSSAAHECTFPHSGLCIPSFPCFLFSPCFPCFPPSSSPPLCFPSTALPHLCHHHHERPVALMSLLRLLLLLSLRRYPSHSITSCRMHDNPMSRDHGLAEPVRVLVMCLVPRREKGASKRDILDRARDCCSLDPMATLAPRSSCRRRPKADISLFCSLPCDNPESSNLELVEMR